MKHVQNFSQPDCLKDIPKTLRYHVTTLPRLLPPTPKSHKGPPWKPLLVTEASSKKIFIVIIIIIIVIIIRSVQRMDA